MMILDAAQMNEKAQAHRYLEKLAMDTRRSLAQTAADILQQEDSPE